jgi:putative ATPase
VTAGTATLPLDDTDPGRPLADRMRPRTLDEFSGQAHLLAEGKPLRLLLEGGSHRQRHV